MADLLTPAEKSGLMSALAKLAGVFFPDAVEQQTAEMVDDALVLAKYRYEQGHWSLDLARAHVSVMVNAAASAYAAIRHIQEQAIRQAVLGVLDVLRTILNARIGFELIPAPQ